jgi:hypothetical protein
MAAFALMIHSKHQIHLSGLAATVLLAVMT